MLSIITKCARAGMSGGLGFAALVAAAIVGHAGGISDKEIVVGTHLDLSGPVSAAMPQLRNGMQMRFDEANEAGGINGRKVRLIVEDNGSQPQLAVRAVDKLIRSDDVFAIVNSFGSGTNAAVVKRAVDAGVLYFSPWVGQHARHAFSHGGRGKGLVDADCIDLSRHQSCFHVRKGHFDEFYLS